MTSIDLKLGRETNLKFVKPINSRYGWHRTLQILKFLTNTDLNVSSLKQNYIETNIDLTKRVKQIGRVFLLRNCKSCPNLSVVHSFSLKLWHLISQNYDSNLCMHGMSVFKPYKQYYSRSFLCCTNKYYENPANNLPFQATVRCLYSQSGCHSVYRSVRQSISLCVSNTHIQPNLV